MILVSATTTAVQDSSFLGTGAIASFLGVYLLAAGFFLAVKSILAWNKSTSAMASRVSLLLLGLLQPT